MDNYFRSLCENVGFGLIAVDRALTVQFWNAQAATLFGRSTGEMLGRSLLEVIQEPQKETARLLVKNTLATASANEIEVKFERDGGRRATLVLIASPINNTAGDCVGASLSVRDISERKRLSQELARSRRLASLGNMAAGVAHHFNNILGGMLTSIDYVLASDSPRELRRTLRLLAQAISRATRITKQLESFAKSEHEKAEWAELNMLLEGFVERVRPRAERASVTVQADLAQVPSSPFEAHRLIPVLESLTGNAFDAMSSGGTLTISLRQEGDEAVIVIADTGCGIPEDVLDRLFEPFFTTKGELGGGSKDNVGLGLAAVHGLVSEMSGSIRLTSKVGVGTAAEVRLPLNRPLDAAASSVPPGEARAPRTY